MGRIKKEVFLVALVVSTVLLCTGLLAEEVKFQPCKFKTVITITYNALTLEQAAKKEKQVAEFAKDACAVDISVEKLVIATDFDLSSYAIEGVDP